MSVAALAAAIVALPYLTAIHATPLEEACAPPGQPLLKIGELKSTEGRLRAVIRVVDQKRAFWLPGSTQDKFCPSPQQVRYFEGYDPLHRDAIWPSEALHGLPVPGPTLRARVGDTVELTLLNHVNLRHFQDSLDRGERGLVVTGCDETSKRNPDGTMAVANWYPGSDVPPNCFHGSSTANLHFHGTHVTPDGLGDNVLVQIRPSLRDPTTDEPLVTEDSVKQVFTGIFDAAEQGSAPTKWSDLPPEWRADQERLLKMYDATAPFQDKNGLPPNLQLWPRNEQAIAQGVWPTYFLGAYPYAYKLTEYHGQGSGPRAGQSPGTHWYHAHKHGSTALNVFNGMAGVFIIEGDYDDQLKAFYRPWGLEENILVFQQLAYEPNLQTAKSCPACGQPLVTVNGQLQPVLTMRPNEVQLWRLVNTCPQAQIIFDPIRHATMETEAGEWRQIAQDGVQFAWENYNRPETWNKEFAMSPANRVDLLVKAPASEGEYKVVIRGGSPGPTLLDRLLTLVVKEDPGRKIAAPAMPFPVRAADYPTFPQFLQDIDPAQVTVRREITFATERGPLRDLTTGAAPKHTINGKQFEDGVIDQMMLLDSVEEWKLINKSQIEHPFHIHINPFQVVARFAPTEGMQDPDKPLRFAAPFRWQDTIAIPAASGGKNGYVIIRHRFDDFPGTYVFHCHILAHEDRGMMQLVRVVDKRTAQRHH